MGEFAKEILSVNIEDELKQSYLDYAMSVIVGRALPDVRDGLKPVHRRVLYAMHELGNDYNKPYKKSARVVGDVIGKYHPHGDTAVYDTIVRMAQPFSMRYVLVDGQGNFGSVDGDAAAAMRYTEVRLAKISHAMMDDLDKETVDFAPNYDETEFAPTVLPTKIPNLLVSGSSGIAVGMATNIPPHNLGEVISATLAVIENPSIDTAGLIEHLPGPDFPTAGIINGRSGIIDAYSTGRGRVIIRSRCEIEEIGSRTAIIITELPYQVNKAKLIERIAELVKEKRLEGISALRDESNKEGMRVVIELKKGEIPDVVINNLYAHTAMQSVFGINMVALVDGRPQVLPLKTVLERFIAHRREVVHRRCVFELNKARRRAHILEGLGIALVNIDPMIELIKSAPSPQVAKDKMTQQAWKIGKVQELLDRAGTEFEAIEGYGKQSDGYKLTPEQAQAILELKLHRLTGLEQDKIFAEYEEVLATIAHLLSILGSDEKLMQVIKDELEQVRADFADARRTEIIDAQDDLRREDLITKEEMVVTLSKVGYVKTTALDAYREQRRGGRGKAAASMKNEDYVVKCLVANTHDTLLCFSSKGKAYWIRVFELPTGSRTSGGRPIINVLPLATDETITAMLPLSEYGENEYIFMATKMGTVKRVALQEFSRPRSSGLIALDFNEDDELVGVAKTNGEATIMLFSSSGKVTRFNEEDVRPMGRTAKGVRGIKLAEGHSVISMVVADAEDESAVLVATENGYGKRTKLSEFPIKGRAGQGVIGIQTSERNGSVVGAAKVDDHSGVMLITDGGTLIRTRAEQISLVGRNTQGVSLIKLSDDEKLVSLQGIQEVDGDDELEAAEDDQA